MPPPQTTSDNVVPIRWHCPVAVTSKVYIAKSDVYSFGVLLFEIFSDGTTPYADLQTTEVVPLVLAGHRLKRPSTTTPEFVIELIRECTQIAVANRPSMMFIEQWLRLAVQSEDRRGEVTFDDTYGRNIPRYHNENEWFCGLQEKGSGGNPDSDDDDAETEL